MKYSEDGFRGFYHNFVEVPVNERTRDALKGFPGEDKANCIVAYGYYDQEAGLTLEVICGAIVDDEGYDFFDSTWGEDISSKIRISLIEDDECSVIDDEDGDMAFLYEEMLDRLKTYQASEEVEKTRDMAFLDGCRHKTYIDDVMVYLTKNGLKPEGCWVTITGLGDHFFVGTLLNEPDQDFGYHEGETIAFFLDKTEDQKIICYSDMNPNATITAEDLADGSMLKDAAEKFNADKNESNFIDVLEILRDSNVWIPCTAEFSENDVKRFKKMVEGHEDDLESLVGTNFTNRDQIRLVPDIVQNGDNYFFPIFSSAEEMGDYGKNFSKIERPMLAAIAMARGSKTDLTGIVLNAFSNPFVLDRGLFDMVEKMKSRILN